MKIAIKAPQKLSDDDLETIVGNCTAANAGHYLHYLTTSF